MPTTTDASAARTCVVVVADDRGSTLEIFQHELAHCNGWTHPVREKAMFGSKKNYYKPPASFVRPYTGKLVQHWVSTKEALEICGAFGCQWFED